MLEYFPNEPVWNFSLALALLAGGNIHEIDAAISPLKALPDCRTVEAQEAWAEKWASLGTRLEGLAERDEADGNLLSAGRKYLTASAYYLVAERQISRLSPTKLATYEKVLHCFRRGIELDRSPVEFVEIPYKGTSLPALFIPATTPGPAPCMIHFDGADAIKELLYFVTKDAYRRRGIALLIVDHPGVGEALRLRNLYTGPDTEVPAGACVDYLESRADVDPDRIGIVALSLGGYYAPRAAAFEKRLKCCVAWGAAWDFSIVVEKLAAELKDDSLFNFQFAWITGQETLEGTLSVARQMTLEGIADKIECPLLVVHGESDRLLPIAIAEKTLNEAVNSPIRTLKIFTAAEGGVEHCQADDGQIVSEYISDWVAGILGGDRSGVEA
jgi:dienelactone hydrolase